MRNVSEGSRKASVYLHVGNSGATFEVADEGQGPVVLLHTSSFGNLAHTVRVHTDLNGLRALAHMFNVAAQAAFSEPHVNLAELAEMYPPVADTPPLEAADLVSGVDMERIRSSIAQDPEFVRAVAQEVMSTRT